MDSHTLIQALIYLGAAALIVPVAVRLGLGSVLGYLIAGCVIGPWGFRLVTDAEAILRLSPVLADVSQQRNRFYFAAREQNECPLAENRHGAFRLAVLRQKLDRIFRQQHIALHSVPSKSIVVSRFTSGTVCKIASRTPPAMALALSETV